jgi:hypothetical protein
MGRETQRFSKHLYPALQSLQIGGNEKPAQHWLKRVSVFRPSLADFIKRPQSEFKSTLYVIKD